VKVTNQTIVLKNCGVIDPADLGTYLQNDGFKALTKAKELMSPEAVIEEIKASGLKGRGGAGFSCGLKWELAQQNQNEDKILICNADESEVGTFKDRYILEKDPFSVIEGIAIATYALGAKSAYLYLRAEYGYLMEALSQALEQVASRKLISGLEFRLQLGAGAYICGEESALMNSLEGRRGDARLKPPFPVDKGLWDQPTVINNVETLVNIPAIILNGAHWFRQIGTEQSKGTKVFSVSGDVEKPGVYELPMGTTLSMLVDMAGASNIKAVQVGGASGSIIPASKLDIPLCFESLLGSGGITVFDQSRDIIEMILQNIRFLSEESCGQCTPCREGLEVMMEIFTRLGNMEGQSEDLDVLADISEVMGSSSISGLGQAAPIPIIDSLKYFRPEYDDRIDKSALIRRVNIIR